MTEDKGHMFVKHIIVAVVHMIYTIGHHTGILDAILTQNNLLFSLYLFPIGFKLFLVIKGQRFVNVVTCG